MSYWHPLCCEALFMARKPIGISKTALNEITPKDLNGTFDYGLKKIPKKAKNDFEELKKEGKVTGSLNAYIIGAFLKRLREEQSQ